MATIEAVEKTDVKLYQGDARELLIDLRDDSVDVVVTSPPYWGMRSYSGDSSEIGCERTFPEYVSVMRKILEELYRVVKIGGSMWLNIGDVYATWAGSTGNGNHGGEKNQIFPSREALRPKDQPNRYPQPGLRPGCLVGIPWRLAFAAIEVGWTLRSEVIWEKPNCRPESAADRPTRSHEHLFLLSKGRSYYFDDLAIREERVCEPGRGGDVEDFRRGRSVWRIPCLAYSIGHPAAMPEELSEKCILSSSKPGELVLDPFAGAGTTLRAANRWGRRAIGFELSAEFCKLARARLSGVQKEMFL